ncbi:MAG TPA: reverse transcriptase domain-containing protein [Candidatus Binatia bacterium]
MRVGIFQQRGPLASDGLLFFLPVRGNPRVNRRCPHAPELHLNTRCLSSGIEFSQEPKADRPEIVSEPPSDQSCKTTEPAWYEPCQPCPPLFWRKASRARVTRTLKDSPVDLAIRLKARPKLTGILTVKTTLRSGIGCIRPTFWASRIYRNACLLETRYRPIKAVTVLVLERSLPKRSSAPLMRWASCVPEDLIRGHSCTTFYVTQSTIIPSSLVGDHPFKLKVCDCVGGVISPLLANIYLHYAFDLWIRQWRRSKARGDVIVVRFADDFVVGFDRREDGERLMSELRERLARFGLELHPEKTRLIEFGRQAEENRRQRGQGKPDSFNFLGFTHSCGRSRRGKFVVLRQTMRGRWQAKLKEVKAELRQRLHEPVPEMGRYLRSVLLGHMRYYGVPFNACSVSAFRQAVGRIWWRVLRRRSQRTHLPWRRMQRYDARWLPIMRICHPYPWERFGVVT